MEKTIVIWFAIVAILLIAFIVREIAVRLHKAHVYGQIFCIAKERELFFCPGDPDDECDDDE